VAIEVRSTGSEAFEDILPLLQRFPTPRITKDDWRWMLFRNAWSDNPGHGFALYEGGKAVGFIGTIFSNRRLLGRMEPICSLSSWIVLEEHRNASLLLLKPIMALRDFTIVNLTPAPVVYEIFSKPADRQRLRASKRCLAGRVPTIGLRAGSTNGQGSDPKKAGLPDR
jgi:acetyltransferase (GNAT) family protein